MNRLGLKLACVVASIVIWIQVASTTNTTADVYVPLEVVNLDPRYTVTGNEEIPSQVQVRVSGSKLRLLAHEYFNKRAGTAQLDLNRQKPGPAFTFEIEQDDVVSDLKVTGINRPGNRFRLRIDNQVTRTLPVAVSTTGELPAERVLLAPLVGQPDSVVVSGPERFLAVVTKVTCEPVDLTKLDKSATLTRKIVSPSPHLVVELTEIAIRANIDREVMKTLGNIPVVWIGDEGQPDAVVSPPVADVMVRGPGTAMDDQVRSQVVVSIPLTGLNAGIYRLAGQVALPDHLHLVAVEPDSFMVIIGDAAVDTLVQERP